ncbi:MAG: SDR family oxidoreductase [Bacteroidota bacterium]
MKASDLKNKVAVITGGGGVLCQAMAKELVQHGVKVAVLDLNGDQAKSVADDLNRIGGDAIGLQADVLNQSSLEHAHEATKEKFGVCDILVNGAGGNHPKGTTTKPHFYSGDHLDPEIISFFDLDPEGVSFVFNLNFIGTLLPTQVFAKDMIGKDDCSIINISSMNAFTPLTKIPAYSGAKAAISNFTQWLAVHFAKEKIRVNAIAPGFFLTNQNRSLLSNEDGSLTERGNTIIEHTPLGRFGDPNDLLGTLIWLCSKDSAFVTGVVIPVDGGFNAFSGV